MREVLISIKPKWCELIANGSKTIEVRKTKPKLETPFKVYIYCTKARNYFSCHGGIIEASDTLYKLPTGVIKCDYPFELQVDYEGQYDKNNFLNGKVIGEFVCDAIDEYFYTEYEHDFGSAYFVSTADGEKTCLEYDELEKYGNGKPLYFWHISNLVIYDKPRELGEFIVPSKIGCVNEGKCRGCIHLDKGNGYNVEDDCSACFSTDEFKPLRKAPQSWCYVESGG